MIDPRERKNIATNDGLQLMTPPRHILRTEADLDAWVAEVRKAVLDKLPDGPVWL